MHFQSLLEPQLDPRMLRQSCNGFFFEFEEAGFISRPVGSQCAAAEDRPGRAFGTEIEERRRVDDVKRMQVLRL